MINLKQLSFSGIGRFVDKQVINIDELGNMTQVDGKRLETGGSSGSGKSTVFNAHDYLLGINNLPAGVLQSRLTKEGIWVEGLYDIDGEEVIITRSKSKGLSVQRGQNEPITGSKLAEEALDAILGMSRDLFRKTIHKRQKEGGFFLDLGPSDTHEFLTKCLGLEEHGAKIAILDKEYDEVKKKADKLSLAYSSARASLSATQDGILNLGLAPSKNFDDSKFEEYSEALNKLIPEHDAFKAKWDAKSKELLGIFKDGEAGFAADLSEKLAELEKDRPSVESTPYDRTNIEKFEKGLTILKDKISAIQTAAKLRESDMQKRFAELNSTKLSLEGKVKTAAKAHTEAKALAAEIKKIRDSLCPTCEQGWATDAAQARETELLAKVKEYKAQIADGKEAEEALLGVLIDMNDITLRSREPVDTTEIDQLNEKLIDVQAKLVNERAAESAHRQTENAANAKASAEFRAKESALRSSHAENLKSYKDLNEVTYNKSKNAVETKLTTLANQIATNTQQLNFINQAKSNYEQAVARHEQQIKTFKAAEKTHQDNVDSLHIAVEAAENELVLNEEARKVVKSFISCSFDSALEEIGDTATRIIRQIPNMANATIQLEGTKETKAGKIKEEVTAMIAMDGELDVPIKSLSGGERSSVDLAVDLAVIDLIHTKSGKGMNIFILDEPFTGLGSAEIEMVLEVLQLANSNKKIIIVDHAAETKSMVGHKINVIRDGIYSRIE